MNRVESIKERLGKGHYIVVLESAYGTPYHDNGPEEDITYLLQRLDRYEEALLKYSDMIITDTEGRQHDVGMVAREALQEGS